MFKSHLNLACMCLVFAACGPNQKAEPIVATDAQFSADAAASDAGVADTTTSTDATRSDLTTTDSARPDSARADTAQPDTETAVDSAVADTASTSDTFVATDASTGGDAGEVFLPTLRIEIEPDFALDDMRVDWEDPDGNVCDDFRDPKTCDWGDFGSISIAGDNYGRRDPNWAEISNARPNHGIYIAEVTGMCNVDSNDCLVDSVRIFVNGTQVREITTDVEVYAQGYFCMPADGIAWDVAGFWWGHNGCTRPDAR